MVYFMDWHSASVIYCRLSIDSAAKSDIMLRIIFAGVYLEFLPYSSLILTLPLQNKIQNSAS